MDIIMRSSRRRGVTKILEVMKPILQPLKRFESVIDVIVQTNGGMGSPIWGPLKLAITVRLLYNPNCSELFVADGSAGCQ